MIQVLGGDLAKGESRDHHDGCGGSTLTIPKLSYVGQSPNACAKAFWDGVAL